MTRFAYRQQLAQFSYRNSSNAEGEWSRCDQGMLYTSNIRGNLAYRSFSILIWSGVSSDYTLYFIEKHVYANRIMTQNLFAWPDIREFKTNCFRFSLRHRRQELCEKLNKRVQYNESLIEVWRGKLKLYCALHILYECERAFLLPCARSLRISTFREKSDCSWNNQSKKEVFLNCTYTYPHLQLSEYIFPVLHDVSAYHNAGFLVLTFLHLIHFARLNHTQASRKFQFFSFFALFFGARLLGLASTRSTTEKEELRETFFFSFRNLVFHWILAFELNFKKRRQLLFVGFLVTSLLV